MIQMLYFSGRGENRPLYDFGGVALNTPPPDLPVISPGYIYWAQREKIMKNYNVSILTSSGIRPKMQLVFGIHSGRLLIRWSPWLPQLRRQQTEPKNLAWIPSRSYWQFSTAVAEIDSRYNYTPCVEHTTHHRLIYFQKHEEDHWSEPKKIE